MAVMSFKDHIKLDWEERIITPRPEQIEHAPDPFGVRHPKWKKHTAIYGNCVVQIHEVVRKQDRIDFNMKKWRGMLWSYDERGVVEGSWYGNYDDIDKAKQGMLKKRIRVIDEDYMRF